MINAGAMGIVVYMVTLLQINIYINLILSVSVGIVMYILTSRLWFKSIYADAISMIKNKS